MLRVITGSATEEEIAAILAAVAQMEPAERESDEVDAWVARTSALRRPLEHGPQAWRTSLR